MLLIFFSEIKDNMDYLEWQSYRGPEKLFSTHNLEASADCGVCLLF